MEQKVEMMRRSVVGLVAAVAVALGSGSTSHAQVRMDIFGASATQLPLAISPLAPLTGSDPTLEREFARILAGDLELSGVFRVLDPSSYIDGPLTGPLSPEGVNFLNWQSIGARGVVYGRYEKSGDDLTLEVGYFDVPKRALLGGRRFRGSARDAARMAHRSADAILEFATGVRGPFDSRIAFISNRGGHAKEVHVLTFDGEVRKVTGHRTVTMAPSWSTDLASVVFTSFRGGEPTLYSARIAGGGETKLASKMGLNIGGAWRPDGRSLAVAREEGGNTDIYLLDFEGQTQQRLTDHWGIDVDPSWSPDGSRLAFCSSRGGTPQVYTMTVSDRAASRVTFDGSYNCSPVWSPDGRYLAYAGRVGRDFHVFVVPAAGGEARQLTFRGSNEDPSWSPDSRYIVFSRDEGGNRKLYIVDITGRWEHELTTGEGDDTSPSWSRRLD